MSFSLPKQRKATAHRSRWPGAAFLVEAMLLLVFVMASLAVFTQLFAASAERANQSKDLTEAVALASATAERFSADPRSIEPEFVDGDMRLVCTVSSDVRQGGTLWHADIQVYPADGQAGPAARGTGAFETGDASGDSGGLGEPLYAITTSVYESGV